MDTRSLPKVVALLLTMTTVSVVGPVPFAPPIAAADSKDAEARMHFRVATAYYDSGRFAEAAEEYRLAHELSKRPQLLYNLFLALRDAGDISGAAVALRQYLAEENEVKDREVLERRLAALEKIVADRSAAEAEEKQLKAPEPEPVVEAEAEPEPVEAQPAPAPVEQESERRLTWLPWTLLGTGVGLVAAGATIGYLGAKDEQTLEDDCSGPGKVCATLTQTEVDELKSDGKFKTVLGDALWIPGAVTAAVGLTLAIWRPWDKSDEQPEPSTPRVDVACSTKACGAVLTGRF